jgi:hypothetical protein
MDYSTLIRDPARVQACLAELPDESLVAKKTIKIYIPVRFAERGLASIGRETHIVGIYAMVVDDAYYAVSMVNAMMRILPNITNTVDIMGDDYYEFIFTPGSTILPSTQLVKIDTLTYKIYDEIIAKGRVPWYLGYPELAQLFNTARYHAGANIGSDHEVIELLVSIISRDPKDITRYYRQVAKTMQEVKKNPPIYTPLKSVANVATNTTNKLAGSYFSEGVVSALVNPAERTERIEGILRA